MRSVIIAVAVILLFPVVSPAAERGKVAYNPDPDWGNMTTQEKIDWAAAYEKHTCPWMPPHSAEEKAKSGQIGGILVRPILVKAFIDNECPKRPEKVAGKK